MKIRISTKQLIAEFSMLIALCLGSIAYAQGNPTEGVSAVYGLVVEPGGSSGSETNLLMATEYGLLRATPGGTSQRVGSLDVALSTLAIQPGDPGRLFLSGFGADGNPVGLFTSADVGGEWTPALDNDQVRNALRSLAISPVNQSLMIALTDEIQISDDGGKTWAVAENTPDQTFSVAPSTIRAGTIYAATMTGLLKSEDGGASWARTYAQETPVTMVKALSGNRMIAFVFGVGLVSAVEPSADWQVLASGFVDRYVLNMAEDPDNPNILFASMDTGALLTSRDGGKSWISFEGSNHATPERLALGKQLFEENCQACHGSKGVGESPGDPEARDEFGFKAPALNDDMHAWHHGDANLVATIQNGSPRNQRMVPFGEFLSDEDIENTLAYVKSLWSIRSLTCQGSRHMGCLGN